MASIGDLRRRVSELEAENARLKASVFNPSSDRTAVVPDELSSVFSDAQRTVREYFKQVDADPARGWIEVGEERYLLVRASALSLGFLDSVRQLYAERGEQEAEAIGRRLLYDIAHSIGIDDARCFHRRMNLTDPVARLAAGPVHFAYTGWALVHIIAGDPVPNDDYVLVYDHPYSFEAYSWTHAGRRSEHPVCIMNAGYSSGWCEESFGLPLVAAELTCRAMGDPQCLFVMAPPDRIEQRVAEHSQRAQPRLAHRGPVTIPEFFENKRLEEELRGAQRELEDRVRERTAELSRTNEMLRDEIEVRSRLETELRGTALANRALASKVIAAQEDERRRVARELHDSIGQMLAALKMDAEWIGVHADDGRDVAQFSERLSRNLTETITSVRTVVRDLRPPVLDDLGVSSALEAIAADVQRRFRVVCECQVLAESCRIPPEMGTAIYRITQEALSNVVKHARATRVRIVLSDDGAGIVLLVQDDGCGMPADSIELAGSMGLVGMRERAALLGGQLAIEAAPAGGTTVTARFPYPPKTMA